ncbi:MAG: sugar nucleotide-binding protein, partial [Flavisolibacter sp.]
AISLIAEKFARGIFHISGKDILTPYQIALAVSAHLGLDASLISKVTWKDFQQAARRPAKTIFDITKARIELGYEPGSFKEGLRRTFLDDLERSSLNAHNP